MMLADNIWGERQDRQNSIVAAWGAFSNRKLVHLWQPHTYGEIIVGVIAVQLVVVVAAVVVEAVVVVIS